MTYFDAIYGLLWHSLDALSKSWLKLLVYLFISAGRSPQVDDGSERTNLVLNLEESLSRAHLVNLAFSLEQVVLPWLFGAAISDRGGPGEVSLALLLV